MSISNVSHIQCRSCETEYEPSLSDFPCPECGGFLDPIYDLEGGAVSKSDLNDDIESMWRYAAFLPIRDRKNIISLGEGLTPLIHADKLANQYDFDQLIIKDEGQNPTNTFKDRGASVTMSGLLERDIRDACIVSVGNAGHAAAAYSARADITCHIYLTKDRGELATTLMQAHGAELHLREDFVSAKEEMETEADKRGWAPLSPFNAPFRHEGKKTMGLELFEQLDWSTPDHLVYPTGGGVGVVGIWKAYQHYLELGWLERDEVPSFNVAQTTGCAPLVRAIEQGESRHQRWDNPQSIARGVMNPDPGASEWIIDIVRKSGGAGIAVSDNDAVTASLEVMQSEGIEMGITSSVALAGAIKLRDSEHIKEDEQVVVVNTGGAGKSAAELSNHLPEL